MSLMSGNAFNATKPISITSDNICSSLLVAYKPLNFFAPLQFTNANYCLF